MNLVLDAYDTNSFNACQLSSKLLLLFKRYRDECLNSLPLAISYLHTATSICVQFLRDIVNKGVLTTMVEGWLTKSGRWY